MKDFFISYSSADRPWAEWIAVALTKSGCTLVIQAWDFRPGSNFVLEMQRATVECSRTIAILSPDWLASVFTQPEWAAAFSLDPTGTNRKLIPVRVRLCEPPGLLRTIVYCDLVGLDEQSARTALLEGVREVRERPTSAVFPGKASASPSGRSGQLEYPGVAVLAPPAQLPSLLQAALSLLGLLRTTRTTFVAQAKLRDQLVWHLQNRLVLNPYARWEYEEFIGSHYKNLDDDERRMFSTMRSFTENILRDYNRRILAHIEQYPALDRCFPAVTALRDHLLVWLAKYEGTFVNTPEMCLLYTGVHEGVAFPRELEAQLWEFLKKKPEARGLLSVESDPRLQIEEHSSSEQSWRADQRLFGRWEQRRFKEIAAERGRLLESAPTAGSGETAEQLKALDVEEASLIERNLYSWQSIPPPQSLLTSLRILLDAAGTSGWPEDFRKALNAAVPAINNPSPGASEVKALLVQLPVITADIGALGINSELPSEWAKFRAQLTDRVLAKIRLDT